MRQFNKDMSVITNDTRYKIIMNMLSECRSVKEYLEKYGESYDSNGDIISLSEDDIYDAFRYYKNTCGPLLDEAEQQDFDSLRSALVVELYNQDKELGEIAEILDIDTKTIGGDLKGYAQCLQILL